MSDKIVLGFDGSKDKEGRFLTYSTVARGFVFTTGSRGYDPATFDPTTESGVLPADFADEVRFALERQRDVIREAGSDVDRIVKVTVYIDTEDPDDLERVNSLVDEFFSSHGVDKPPARLVVRASFVVGRVAIDVVATVPGPEDRVKGTK